MKIFGNFYFLPSSLPYGFKVKQFGEKFFLQKNTRLKMKLQYTATAMMPMNMLIWLDKTCTEGYLIWGQKFAETLSSIIPIMPYHAIALSTARRRPETS